MSRNVSVPIYPLAQNEDFLEDLHLKHYIKLKFLESNITGRRVASQASPVCCVSFAP